MTLTLCVFDLHKHIIIYDYYLFSAFHLTCTYVLYESVTLPTDAFYTLMHHRLSASVILGDAAVAAASKATPTPRWFP